MNRFGSHYLKALRIRIENGSEREVVIERGYNTEKKLMAQLLE